MSVMRIAWLCAWIAAQPALAETNPASGQSNNVPGAGLSGPGPEQVRSACVAGRRCICGKVLLVTSSGLVVDSGYPRLLQPPLNHSWVTHGNVNLARPATLLEANTPDSIAVGLVLLTDIPKRPAVHQYDYVALIGYPAGHYDYTPVSGVKKTIRRFAGGLERAVTLTMQAEHTN